jgi:predicted metal-dependent hydrolase
MSKVKYLNKTIPYTVNKAKIKNIYISIQNGEVVIKAPWYTTSNQIQEIVESKREWITKKLQEYQTSPRKTKDYADGETFQVLGEKYTLNIYYKDIANGRLNIADGHISIVLPLVLAEADNTERIKSMMDKMYFMIAQREVELAMEKTRKLTGLAPDEYNIKKLKSVWGKCTSSKKITINQDLMMYSRHAIEYVVLHEFCHLKYMNHSKNFWSLVEQYMPDYKDAERELKK